MIVVGYILIRSIHFWETKMTKLLDFKKYLSNRIKEATYHSVVIKILIAVAAVSLFLVMTSEAHFDTAEYFLGIKLLPYMLALAGLFALLFFVIPSVADPYIFIALLCGLFAKTNYDDRGIYFALVTSLVAGGFVFYFGKRLRFPTISRRGAIIICAVLGGLLALFVGGLTILKFLDHRTPNFDFGIFAQMYHYMSKTLIPYTTCERDMLLSHFAVHFSPILYVALPIYMIFPNPATILAVQAIAVALGVIPLYKLSKHFGLSNNKTIAVIIIYVLHPSVIANNFYYFHENCFLTVLLLSLFYFAEKGKRIPMYIFALLTMFVKEDAPIYVLFFGLYLIFSNKTKLHGALLSLLSMAYFVTTTSLMAVFGQGVMTYRYDNFIFEEGGSLVDVVLNVIKNPTFVFDQILTVEKLEFLIPMLIPMALLPFAIKKPSRLILLCPMLLVNLMSNYVYQFDIGFQYTYASLAFLFYLAVMNLGDLNPDTAKRLLTCGVCASVIFFASINLGRMDTIKVYEKGRETSEIITEALTEIPEDKSITATTFLVPPLWNRDEVYEYKYTDEVTDYAVFDLRWGEGDYRKFERTHPDYDTVNYKEGIIAVLVKK